jgi:hypothetical protein
MERFEKIRNQNSQSLVITILDVNGSTPVVLIRQLVHLAQIGAGDHWVDAGS